MCIPMLRTSRELISLGRLVRASRRAAARRRSRGGPAGRVRGRLGRRQPRLQQPHARAQLCQLGSRGRAVERRRGHGGGAGSARGALRPGLCPVIRPGPVGPLGGRIGRGGRLGACAAEAAPSRGRRGRRRRARCQGGTCVPCGRRRLRRERQKPGAALGLQPQGRPRPAPTA